MKVFPKKVDVKSVRQRSIGFVDGYRTSLVLDFTSGQSIDPRISFSRASTKTRFNSSGVIETVASGVPAITFDPVTGVCRGVSIESAATNLLLNSATLATQSITVTAIARTLSFYGTGTVVLSGAHSATVVGVGAYPARTTYTYTPTAGTLTLTVTGTVQFANDEAGAFATSYIPTTSAAATRSADVMQMTGTNFSSWYRQDEGTFVVHGDCSGLGALAQNAIYAVGDGTSTNRFYCYLSATPKLNVEIKASGVQVGNTTTATNYTYGAKFAAAFAFKSGDCASSVNGAAISSVSAAYTMSAQHNVMVIGSSSASQAQLNGCIARIAYYPKRLTNAELQRLTA